MKKLFCLVAFAALVLVSCHKEDKPTKDEISSLPKVDITIIASEKVATKTELTSENKIIWSTGDQLAVFQTNSASTPKMVKTTSQAGNTNDSGKTMTFVASFDTDSNSPFTYNAIYPASSVVQLDDPKNNNDLTELRVLTPATQNPTATSFDRNADLLIAKSSPNHASQGDALSMQFRRAVAIGALQIKNLSSDANVKEIKFTFPNKVVTGRSSHNLTTGETVSYAITNYEYDNVLVNYDGKSIAANGMTAYFTCFPFDLEAGDKFTVKVYTVDNKSFTKEFSIPNGKTISFTEGNISAFGLNMSGVVGQSEESLADKDYVLLVHNADKSQYFAMQTSTTGSGSNTRMSSTNFTYTGQSTYTGSDETIIWTIKACGSNYALYNGSKYISWSSGNYAILSDNAYELTFTKQDDDTYKIASKAQTDRILARNNSNAYFAFYTGSGYNEFTLLPVGSAASKVATPTFSVEEGTYDSAQSVEISCTTDGATIYYTLDGSDPSTSSTEYTSAISISETKTLKAIAIKEEMENSDIASATYTINGTTPSPTTSWELTDLANLNGNDIFVIVGNGVCALPNDGSGSPVYTSITISDNCLASDPADNLKWNVSGNSTDGYTFYPNGITTKWLCCNTTAGNGSNDKIRVDNGARKVWSLNANNYLVTKDDYSDRYLSIYQTQDWRGYLNTNNNPAVLTFYKYTINDGKSDAEVSLSYSGDAITYGDSPVTLTITNPHNVEITCTAEPAGVVTVSNNGAATIVGAGTTSVIASWPDKTEGETTYRAGSVTYELTVAKKTPAIAAFNNPNTSVEVNGTVTNTTTISDNLTITYTTSDPTVASIDESTGAVTGVADGSATISATFTGNDNFNAATPESYTITVGNGGSDTPTLKYTLNGVDNLQGESYNNYATAHVLEFDGIEWSITGNLNIDPWRIGGKGKVTRALYTTDAISSNISSIKVESGTANATVNSITITVHSSASDAASGNSPIATKSVTSSDDIISSTVTLTNTDNTSWAGKYYRIAYDLTCNTGSNNYIQFISAKFYGTN